MTNRLIINPGTPQTWQIDLNPGLNRIGRGESNDFVINHPSVSTHHCEVTVTDTTVTVRDLGSTNGTFVERVPVNAFQLHNGQHVQFGSVDMMFDTDMSPALPSPAVNMPAAGGRIVLANPGTSAPAPQPPAPPSAPPPPPPVGGGLKINRAAHAAPPPPAATPAGANSAGAPPVRRLQPKSHDEFAAEREITDRKMFIRGIGGAALGGFVGMLAWAMITIFTGMEFGYAAWGVGLITGGMARLFARQGSTLQGLVCAGCAVLGIFGGQYFAAKYEVDKEFRRDAEKEYKHQLKMADAVLIPQTQEEIIAYIAGENEMKASEVTEADIRDFKKQIPELQDLKNGKPSKEEFIKSHLPDKSSLFYNLIILFNSIGLFTLLWLLLGVASAYKIGSGNDG